MKHNMPLNELLRSPQEKTLLFLGREGTFTDKEIARFLKKFNAKLTTDYEEGLVAVVEHSMLNPVEEDISNLAYEKGLPLYTLQEFEKILSETINDDELLMGIKLSNDQNRIFRLLGNEHISNALFVKLLNMYEWDEEDEDSREDRDVIMYTLRRYIDIKPNEEDLLYSYLTLRRLAAEATDPQLLSTLIRFPNFEFLVRGKEKLSLRETIARNEYIDETAISKLTALRDEKVNAALACNKSVPLPHLKNLLAKTDKNINEALATNSTIDDDIFTALLNKEDKVVQLLLLTQNISTTRLDSIEKHNFSENLFAAIAANTTLSPEIISHLLTRENEELLCHLAANPALDAAQLQTLYEKNIPASFPFLAANPSSSVKMLEMFYADHNAHHIYVALANNPSTPAAILRELFDKDDFDIHKSMASNASVPMELLDILKVDTRLQNELSQNEIFAKAFETVLDYDKKAVQF